MAACRTNLLFEVAQDAFQRPELPRIQDLIHAQLVVADVRILLAKQMQLKIRHDCHVFQDKVGVGVTVGGFLRAKRK